MSDINIKIDGIEKLDLFFDKVVSDGKLEKAVGQGCAIVERSAKQKAPKDTGALRRSIESKTESKGNTIEGIIYTPLEYAPYVEYGTGLFAEKGGRQKVPWVYQADNGEWHSTKGQAPQPYMRPALIENKQAIIKKIKEGITND